jgi:diguanylate cyclase (GGDEF)-like protein
VNAQEFRFQADGDRVDASLEVSAHVLRARKTAALARATLALAGNALVVLHPALAHHPVAAAGGFAFIVLTSTIQLVAPSLRWLKVEESVAGLAGVLIVGLSDERVNVLAVLWLAAVASGVLARGGRVHWIGSAVLMSALALPILVTGRVTPEYLGLCLASLGLLLTCGRLTRELNHLLERARHDADHDGLTGALSRTAFRAMLDRVDSMNMNRPGDAALLLLDLDCFGQTNKQYGHAAGDALLAVAVESMRDVLGPAARIGRLGGDEFGALVPGEEPAVLARRVLDRLSQPPVVVPASVGIVHVGRHGRDAEALLRAADVALRVAKRGGEQQIATYAGESFGEDGPTGARGALARLIEGDGIAMVVQPIVDRASGEVHAYEALARFQTRGTDSPLHWFALADEFGRREELELACLDAALRLLDDLPGGARLSVNLSGPVLMGARAQALFAARPDVSRLIVEVTEEALVQRDASLVAALAPLLARGAHFAIDDMGAGYSGLRQITALHPTYLKLDRSLVRGIDTDPDRAALLRALVGYAQQTGAHLVAEGVETAAELATVSDIGVPLIQGWYYGRPAAPWPQLQTPEPSGPGTRAQAAA